MTVPDPRPDTGARSLLADLDYLASVVRWRLALNLPDLLDPLESVPGTTHPRIGIAS